MPEALLAVDQGGGEAVAGHRGVGMHEPGAGPLDVPAQHADAVRVHPAQVDADHEIGGQGRVAAPWPAPQGSPVIVMPEIGGPSNG
jgi:hypothetical protein